MDCGVLELKGVHVKCDLNRYKTLLSYIYKSYRVIAVDYSI